MYYYSMNELCEECIAFDRCGCCITQFSVVCRGYGGFGALGHYVYHRELLPRQVKGPWEGKIRHIATSGAHTAAITDSGRSDSLSMLNYSLGSSNTILCNQMAVMSCHSGLLLQLKLLIFDNCALLTGELYTWGRDEGDGRLGLGSGGGPGEAGSLSVPSKVNSLPVPVAAVACGGFFTMALTSDGQLWSWGG